MTLKQQERRRAWPCAFPVPQQLPLFRQLHFLVLGAASDFAPNGDVGRWRQTPHWDWLQEVWDYFVRKLYQKNTYYYHLVLTQTQESSKFILKLQEISVFSNKPIYLWTECSSRHSNVWTPIPTRCASKHCRKFQCMMPLQHGFPRLEASRFPRWKSLEIGMKCKDEYRMHYESWYDMVWWHLRASPHVGLDWDFRCKQL